MVVLTASSPSMIRNIANTYHCSQHGSSNLHTQHLESGESSGRGGAMSIAKRAQRSDLPRWSSMWLLCRSLKCGACQTTASSTPPRIKTSSPVPYDLQTNYDSASGNTAEEMDPRAAPPPQPAGTYSVAQSGPLTEQSANATDAHLLAAADYITRLFEANQVPFAFMGGFSMNIRGSQRSTYDIDVAIGCEMSQLLAVVSAQTLRYASSNAISKHADC